MIGFLTILGYSLYDTVVVFDRPQGHHREAGHPARMTYSEAANLAVNQTLVRSINTSIIALLPVAAILFVGGGLLGAGTLKDLSLRCSSVSPPAPTPRSSSPRRCWPSSRSASRRCRPWPSGSQQRRAAAAKAARRRGRGPGPGGRGRRGRTSPVGRRREVGTGGGHAVPRRQPANPQPATTAGTARQEEAPLTEHRPRLAALLASRIRDVPDYPKPGVVFKDITPLLADPAAFAAVVDALGRTAAEARARPRSSGSRRAGSSSPRRSRYAGGLGFVPVRKQGKLPGDVFAGSPTHLEYGEATLEVQQRRLPARGTGCWSSTTCWPPAGPPRPRCDLVRRAGAQVVGVAVLLELGFLRRPRAAGRGPAANARVCSVTV